jgi:hypothetical protein
VRVPNVVMKSWPKTWIHFQRPSPLKSAAISTPHEEYVEVVRETLPEHCSQAFRDYTNMKKNVGDASFHNILNVCCKRQELRWYHQIKARMRLSDNIPIKTWVGMDIFP